MKIAYTEIKKAQGLVKVSTGVLQLEKLSARNALNGKLNLNADNNQYALAA